MGSTDEGAGSEIIENEELVSMFRKKWSVPFWILAAAGIGLLMLVIEKYRCGGTIPGFEYWGNECLRFFNIKDMIVNSAADYCNMVVTYNAILTAAVVFFYSMLDSRRVGIPYRTIISYTFGSRSIPVLFLITLIGSFLFYPLLTDGRNTTVFVIASYIFIVQLTIIIVILRSTSFRHCIKVVSRIENRQYKELRATSEKREYIWLYFLRHLEYAVQSNEISTDKMRMVRAILWTPFCEKRSFLKRYCCPAEPAEDSRKDHLPEHLYRFYYENLTAAFQHLRGEENHIKRNEFYSVLYEFIDKFEKWQKMKNSDEEKRPEIFLTVVSGVINAVLVSHLEEAEAVCRYILECCITDKKAQKQQAKLYVLFWQVVALLNADWETSEYAGDITCLYDWNWAKEKKDRGLYAKFWFIWMQMYSLSLENKMEYFEKAILAMEGVSNSSGLVSYIILQIEQMRKGADDADKSSAAD